MGWSEVRFHRLCMAGMDEKAGINKYFVFPLDSPPYSLYQFASAGRTKCLAGICTSVVKRGLLA